jgi:hypothetical protein
MEKWWQQHHKENNLYQITCTKMNGVEMATLAQCGAKQNMLRLWHQCLDHLNVRSENVLPSMVSGIDLASSSFEMSSLTFEGCIEGQQQDSLFQVMLMEGVQPRYWRLCIQICTNQ